MKYVQKEVEGKLSLLRVSEDLATDLVENSGYEETSKEDFWKAQSKATLEHFTALEAIDPTALTEEEEVLVAELLEAKNAPEEGEESGQKVVAEPPTEEEKAEEEAEAPAEEGGEEAGEEPAEEAPANAEAE
jgi:hypothetical protein